MKQPSALFLGNTRMEFESLDSTNRYARSILDSGTPEGTLILAHNQTAGKGLASNTWYAQSHKNLSFSLILYPRHLPGNQIFLLTCMVSLAMVKTVKNFFPEMPVQIKWPNDILINGKKICGILIENTWKSNQLHTSIIGIGVNLNTTEFPEELQAKASSLFLETGQETDSNAFINVFCSILEALYLQNRNNPRSDLKQHYLGALWKYQEWSRFEWDGAIQDGMIIGVDTGGKLAIQTRENAVKYFDLKEIVYH
jgi:BirA family biotin operon repressor/biotin-[acetyl-CoA-carboxylase] ligase